jgi:transposase
MQQENFSRLKEFRQLKIEIRGSHDYLIVGIDVAKDKHNAFFGTAMGRVLYRRLIFDNDSEGFGRLMLQAEATTVQHSLKKVVYGLEPTANYHKPLGEYLIKNGCTVVLVGTEAVKKNRTLLDGRWDKHDTKDSANVADLIAQGKCLYYEYPSEELRDLRNLLSLQRKLKKMEHALRMRIRNHLVAQYFPELDKCCNWGAHEGLAIVKSCLNPKLISNLQYDEFLRKIQTRGRSLAQQKRLSHIWSNAYTSIGSKVVPSVDFEARMIVNLLGQVRMSITDTQEQIHVVCREQPEYECLLSIPGFGPDISAKVLGAIGDPWRFDTGAQVLKTVGMDLSASRSGKNSDGVTPSISKKGKSELRYALYQAALISSSRNKYFIEYFTNKLRGREKEKGIKTKMRVKLAAKMLVIAWTLMKKKEQFDPKYLNRE